MALLVSHSGPRAASLRGKRDATMAASFAFAVWEGVWLSGNGLEALWLGSTHIGAAHARTCRKLL